MSRSDQCEVSPKIEFELMGLSYNEEALAMREVFFQTSISELQMDGPRGPEGRAMILRRSLELMEKLPAPSGSELETKENEAKRLVRLICDEKRPPQSDEETEALKYILLRDLYGMHVAPELYKQNATRAAGSGCLALLICAPLGWLLGLEAVALPF